jgi:hypothetical protein
MIDQPIIIVGAARSGTSMVAGSINACGAFGGNMGQDHRSNPKGMFENLEIRERIIKSLLRGLKADPQVQRSSPKIETCHALAEKLGHLLRDRVKNVMRRQGYEDGRWFYKCPKSCHLWPIWHNAFPEAQWVIVRRRDEDIITSCLKTHFMRAYSNRSGWQGWVDTHKARFGEMVAGELKVWQIWPQRIIDGQFGELQELISWLGLTWNNDGVLDFITPALWTSGVFEIKG